MKVFLDANVLLSAAGARESYQLLLELSQQGRIELITSAYCLDEARRNLAAKRPQHVAAFARLAPLVRLVPDSVGELPWARKHVDRHKDVPLLAAAVKAEADVLLTKDVADFGHLMRRNDLPIRIKTVRRFLIDGPDDPPPLVARSRQTRPKARLAVREGRRGAR